MKLKTPRFLYSVLLMSSLIVVDMSCSSDDDDPALDCTTLAVVVPPANIVLPTNCGSANGQLTAAASGGSGSYQFRLGSGAFQSSAVFSNLNPGTYIITVKDSKGCETLSANVEVANVGSTLDASVSDADQDTDCFTGNGTIAVTATGGTAPYQYKFGDGSFEDTSTFSDLETGSYSITVKDADNCNVVVNAVVSQGPTDVTYTADIKPIFEAKCQFAGCHPANGDWFTYSVAKSMAALIKTKTGNKSMPKGGVTAPGGALSDEQIKLIACWVDEGAPE